jgi:hypothetical protein
VTVAAPTATTAVVSPLARFGGDHRWLLGCVAVTAVGGWSTRSFWWPGRYVVTFDATTYTAPNLEVTTAAARRWSLALRNDGIFGGVTHLGNPQTGSLYPLRLLALLLEVNRAMGILVALHVVFLAIGIVLLCRALGYGVLAATTAGCAIALSGMALTRALQFEQILVIAWMPWLILGVRSVLRGARPWRAIAGLAVATAATVTAGHPQVAVEAVFLASVAVLASLDRRSVRRLPHLALAILLGALVALPQLVAAAIATSQSAITGGRTTAQLLDPTYSTTREALPRAVLGSMTTHDQVSFVGSFEGISFVGVAVAVLAVLGLVVGVRTRTRRAWTVGLALAAVFAALWSTGPRSIVFRATNRIVPGFDVARVPARWMIVVSLVLVLLAAGGLDALVRRQPRRPDLLIAAAIVTVGGLVLVIARLADRAAYVEWTIVAVAVLALAWWTSHASALTARTGAMALAVVVMVELGVMSLHALAVTSAVGTPLDDPSYRTPTTAFLRDQPGFTMSFTDDGQGPAYSVPGLRPNANVLAGVRSVDGYDGGVQITKRWADAVARLQTPPDLDLPMRNAVPVPFDPVVLGRLGVRFVLIDRRRPAAEMTAGWIGPRAVDDRFVVYENPAWRGEAVAWPASQVAARDEMPTLLRERSAELADRLLVLDAGDVLTCLIRCSPVGIPVVRHTPEHVTITADLAATSIVTLDQQFADGWHVSVDGKRADVIEGDGFVVAVRVDAGHHLVEWRYRPGWLTPSLIAAALALLATLALALAPMVASAARSRSMLAVNTATE